MQLLRPLLLTGPVSHTHSILQVWWVDPEHNPIPCGMFYECPRVLWAMTGGAASPWWEGLPVSSMWVRARVFPVVLAQPAPEQVPQGCTGIQQREAGTQTQPTIEWHALPLTGLTVCVAEDTYSSEETVDHQPVHLRVMDTADLVTLPP